MVNAGVLTAIQRYLRALHAHGVDDLDSDVLYAKITAVPIREYVSAKK